MSNIVLKRLSNAQSYIDKLWEQLQDLIGVFSVQCRRITAESLSISPIGSQESPVDFTGSLKYVKNVGSQYEILDTVNEILSDANKLITIISLEFRNEVKVQEYLNSLSELVSGAEKLKQQVIDFLNSTIRTQTIPPQFTRYVQAVVKEMLKYVSLESYEFNYYVSDYESSLLYSCYLRLPSKDKEHYEQRILTIHWFVGSSRMSSQIGVNLDYGFRTPSISFKESMKGLESSKDAVAAISQILTKEGLTKSDVETTSAPELADLINSIDVQPSKLTVELKTHKNPSWAKSQVYLGVLRLFGKGCKAQVDSPSTKTMVFLVDSFGPIPNTNEDVAYFMSWGISYSQLEKLQTILRG